MSAGRSEKLQPGPERIIVSDLWFNSIGIVLCFLLMPLSVRDSGAAMLLLMLALVFLYRIKWCVFKENSITYGKVFLPRSREISYEQVESFLVMKKRGIAAYFILRIDLDDRTPFFFKEINILPLGDKKAKRLIRFLAERGQSDKLIATGGPD